MQKLIRGVNKFQREVYVQNKTLYAKLAEGQAPHTLFITCSDSRINPSTLTQSEPGEVFIVRNAGNIVPPHGPTACGETATIEYAVAALGVSDVVICGHSHCGAMKGLLSPESLKDLPCVADWLDYAAATRAIVQQNYPDRSPEELHNLAIQENVLIQLENIKTLPSVAARLASGSLGLHGWVYKIDTCEVFAYSPEDGQFLPLSDRNTRLPHMRRSFE